MVGNAEFNRARQSWEPSIRVGGAHRRLAFAVVDLGVALGVTSDRFHFLDSLHQASLCHRRIQLRLRHDPLHCDSDRGICRRLLLCPFGLAMPELMLPRMVNPGVASATERALEDIGLTRNRGGALACSACCACSWWRVRASSYFGGLSPTWWIGCHGSNLSRTKSVSANGSPT